MATQLEIANLALLRMGHGKTIATLGEDSQEGDAESIIWPFQRTTALRAHPWGFATFIEPLTGILAVFTLVSDDYEWTESVTTPGEFYLEAAGGGDPELVEPMYVSHGGDKLPAGTLGSLGESEWAFGDNDAAIAFNTIYVRLPGNDDPDSEDVLYHLDEEYKWVYDLPTDFLHALYVTVFARPLKDDPKPFEVRGGKLYTNEEQACLKFIKDITDTTLWDMHFANALAWLLASEFASVLTGNLQRQEQMMQKYAEVVATARARDAAGNKVKPEFGRGLINARGTTRRGRRLRS